MWAAFVVLTTDCNSQCRFCFYQQIPGWHKRSAMDPKRFAMVLSRLKQRGLAHIYLTGGEPTIVGGLDSMIEMAAANGITTILLSNGLRATEDSLKRMRASGLDIFVLNLNPLWDSRSPAKLERLVKALKANFEDRTSGIFVFTKSNYKSLPKLVDLLERLEFGAIVQPAYIPDSSPDRGELCPYELDDDAWKLIDDTAGEFMRSSGLKRYWELVIGLRRPESMGEKPAYCPMGTDACVVDADGTVYPCFHRRDLSCGNIIGDPPDVVMRRLAEFGLSVSDAHCFGRHCVSLFTHSS